jgi:small-conductance mechanosensitive channel
MGGGIFILLAFLALMIGVRARNSNANRHSEKAKAVRKKIKKVLSALALILIVGVLAGYIPSFVEYVKMSIDTHFDYNVLIGSGIILVGLYTCWSIVKFLRER